MASDDDRLVTVERRLRSLTAEVRDMKQAVEAVVEIHNKTRRGAPNIGVWIRLLTPLKERPGEMLEVRTMNTLESAKHAVKSLRRGALLIPEGRWEFNREGLVIYARFLGED